MGIHSGNDQIPQEPGHYAYRPAPELPLIDCLVFRSARGILIALNVLAGIRHPVDDLPGTWEQGLGGALTQEDIDILLCFWEE